VDHQLEFDRGLDWKLSRSLALEDAIDVRRCAPKIIDQVISIGQQAADRSELTVWIDGREAVARRQRCDLSSTRWASVKVSGITTRPPFGARACSAMTDSSSDLS